MKWEISAVGITCRNQFHQGAGHAVSLIQLMPENSTITEDGKYFIKGE